MFSKRAKSQSDISMLKSNDSDNPTNLDDLDAELDEISADGADDTES